MADKYEEQMEMFEDGGLKDEGGTVDPVSGNDVPSGSTQSEVRDDIPAQLSEGEFVLPADVVRYIGLENLMELRNKAKQGLAQMEAMGQMGNSEEATMPDTADMEVDIDAMIDEFDPNDPELLSFADGGVVKAYNGAAMIQGGSAQGMMQQPQQGYQAPVYQASGVPTGQQLLGGVQSPVTYGTQEYIGPNNQIINVTTINGNPVQDIPAGYRKYNRAVEGPVSPVIDQPQVQPDVQDNGGGRDEEEESIPGGFDYGLSTDEQQGILSTINEDLAKAVENKPKGVVGVLSAGILGNVINGIQRGYYSMEARNQVREGFGLTKEMKPEYANWRGNVSTSLAASMLATEEEARDVAETGNVEGSSFGSRAEAKAVAESGWGSDAHLEQIDRDIESQPETRGGDGRDRPDTSPETGPSSGTSPGRPGGESGERGESDGREESDGPSGGFGSSSEAHDMGSEANPDRDDGGFGLAKGGSVVDQTERALKASRRKSKK